MKTDTVIVSVSAMGSEFQTVGPEYIKLGLDKSNLGVETLIFLRAVFFRIMVNRHLFLKVSGCLTRKKCMHRKSLIAY